MSELQPPPPTSNSAALFHDQQVANLIGQGYTIQLASDSMTVLVRNNQTNHVLHLILSVLTVGVWLPVWLIIAAGNNMNNKTVTVQK